jgi:putative CocE/NonD family hydrolase
MAMSVLKIETIENYWIPMPDGKRLSARIWMPENSVNRPVPGILEYIPYRKGDFTAVRDSGLHPWFAARGYACVRVDLRGSGDSDGVLKDEYLEQELEDGENVIRWIADQPWCDGNVGMIGISWGGFNGLQIAARDVPQLKALITVSSTDDRYADDVHYMGGCLLSDNLSWASTMFAYNSCPPDPMIVGDRWKKMWIDRLEHSGLWLHTWLSHQTRDDYWKHGSVCEDFFAIRCPVYTVSGWADGYSNAVFRILEGLDSPRKGLIGSWGHRYPHIGEPGPAIGFLQEALLWWDRWLKGKRNKIMKEPMLRVWMQDGVDPEYDDEGRPGRWVAESPWPSLGIRDKVMVLNPGRLDPSDVISPEEGLPIQSPLSVGLFAGKWCSYSASTDLPTDQREEDGGALIFDSQPLDTPIEILGSPIVEIQLSSNRPDAMIAVRLSDIALNGKVTRVTYGLLNLAHRESHEHPKALKPGHRYCIRVKLNEIGQIFRKGHRMRVAVSTSYWPLAWPSPEPVKLTIFSGKSRIILPVRKPRPEDSNLPPIPKPVSAETIKTKLLTPNQREWTVTHNLANNEITVEITKDDGAFRLENNRLEVHKQVRERYIYNHNIYNSVRGEVRGIRTFRRKDWFVKTITKTVLTSDEAHFFIRAELDAYEGDVRIFCRTWDEKVARNHV